jgi:hypothetical protein
MRVPASIARAIFRAMQTRIADKRPPDFIIGAPDDDYLRRWFVIPRNGFFNIYLHEFRRSDDDRALHDHPWWNVSLLLQNEYVEHTIPQGGINLRKLYKAGDLKFRSAKSAHRVELTNGATWSLFITGPNVRTWGFHCPTRWVPWQEFTKPENPGEIGRGCGEGNP